MQTPAQQLGKPRRACFDLYFLTLSPGETWQDAMDRLEEAATSAGLDDEDLTRWDAVRTDVEPLLPDAEEFTVSLIESSVPMPQGYSCRCHTAS
jgi:hypothetical protein